MCLALVYVQKKLIAGTGKFVPYAGIRYMHLTTGDYTNSLGMHYDTDNMNLWLLPVGIKYSADIKMAAGLSDRWQKLVMYGIWVTVMVYRP